MSPICPGCLGGSGESGGGPENCVSPCNCLVTEDGFNANRSDDGRRNTVVSGFGSINDPYVIEFQQSEFYRPPSGERRSTHTLNVSTTGTFGIFSVGAAFIDVYQSPGEVFIIIPTSVVSNYIAATRGYFNIVGASATFAPSNTTGARKLMISGSKPDGLDAFLTGVTQHGSASVSTILTCSMMTPGVFIERPTNGIKKGYSHWIVTVRQNSGAPINVSNVKFWMTTL